MPTSYPQPQERADSPQQDTTAQTVEIPLTRGQIAVVDEYDADLALTKWQADFNPRYAGGGKFVAKRTFNRKTILMHRLILSRVHGRELKRCERVDHINGDTLDNRRSNLRLATPSQNGINTGRRKHNTSGYKGVSFHKFSDLWRARISKDGKVISLGYFHTAETAGQAYWNAALELHGEFARLDWGNL